MFRRGLTLRATLLLGLGTLVLVSAAVSALSYRNILDNATATGWVRHTQVVLNSATATLLTLDDIDSGFREYLLTGSAEDLGGLRADISRYSRQLTDLASMTT